MASMDMDISMDIHVKSVYMGMNIDVKFHIHGQPGKCSKNKIAFLNQRRAIRPRACYSAREIRSDDVDIRTEGVFSKCENH